METRIDFGHAANDEFERIGRWEVLPYESQIEAVHTALLHTGKVLYFSGFRIAEAVKTETRLWNPSTGEFKAPQTPNDIFCAGHSFLPDGRLLVVGGTLEYRGLPNIPPWIVRLLRPLTGIIVRLTEPLYEPLSPTGTTIVNLFDPGTEQWVYVGEMKEGRWYPTTTILPDGRILMLSGANEGGGFHAGGEIKTNRRVEVYGVAEGLKYVTSIPEMKGHGDGNHQQEFPSLYPRMHVLPLAEEEKERYPAGKLFCSGYGPGTKFLNIQNWEWEDVDQLKYGTRHDGSSVLLPLRPPEYRPRVLTFGGSAHGGHMARATETAEIINLGSPNPTWEWADSMHDKRTHACPVILPDGKIMVVGGNSVRRFDEPVLNVDVFDPANEKWHLVAPIPVPRGYHDTAILLPDGRVLSSGTTPFQRYELRMAIYLPYYMFRGERPRSTTVPPQISYGKSFEVSYEHSGPIQQVVLIKPGSMTHSFDFDQRYIELAFTPGEPGRLIIEAPPDVHIAPPGYYMFFLLSTNGVPSEAKFVHLPVPS